MVLSLCSECSECEHDSLHRCLLCQRILDSKQDDTSEYFRCLSGEALSSLPPGKASAGHCAEQQKASISALESRPAQVEVPRTESEVGGEGGRGLSQHTRQTPNRALVLPGKPSDSPQGF